MLITEMFEAGLVDDLGVPERVITAHLSKLYVFGTRIFKVYKHEKYFFADLSNTQERKAFIAEDFIWNNEAAPETYQHLWGFAKKGDAFSLVPHTLGEDLVVEMLVIDDSQTLTKLLVNNALTPAQGASFIDSLVDVLRGLTAERGPSLSDLFEKPLDRIVKDDIETLYVWMLDTDPIPKADTERLKSAIFAAIDAEPYFKNLPRERYSAAIDANSDNLIVLQGKPSMIDIMPPRRTWRVVDEPATVTRPIVDIEVLGTPEAAQAARDSYAKYQAPLPELAQLVHEARAAGIQWAYRYMLNQPKLAEKFGRYAMAKAAEIESKLK